MERIICLAAGYLCGLFQTGYIYGKLHGIDIRSYGSGNSGSTNALRVMGKKAGLTVFVGDSLKTVIPCFITRLLFKDQPELMYVYMLYTGLGVILGHNFPFYLGFKGGKGIAATAGILLAVNPKVAIVAYLTFIVIVVATRYVSLGSIILVIMFAIGMVVQGEIFGTTLTVPERYELYALSIFLTILAIYKHKENIKRLLHGTENKLSFSKKK